LKGKRFIKNEKKAFELYSKSATKGNAEALYLLGMAFCPLMPPPFLPPLSPFSFPSPSFSPLFRHPSQTEFYFRNNDAQWDGM
jgi:hypothetical protein